MNRKRLQPYLDVFDELRVNVDEISFTGGCHLKFHVSTQKARRFFIAPVSGSDNKGVLNFRQDVRRWLRSVETSSV